MIRRYTPHILVAESYIDFGLQARRAFLSAVSPSGNDRVALPTGNTPKPFYEALKRMRGRTFAYLQLDEYQGLPDPADMRLFSNWLARDILDAAGIERRQIFNSAADPSAECARIAAFLDVFPVNVAVIGIGENGHIGFNEPGSAFDSTVRVVNLMPGTLAQNNAYWNCDDLPGRAFTLGIGDLMNARATILLVRGAHKADILRKAFEGPVTSDVPASYLQLQSNVTVVADRAAIATWRP